MTRFAAIAVTVESRGSPNSLALVSRHSCCAKRQEIKHTRRFDHTFAMSSTSTLRRVKQKTREDVKTPERDYQVRCRYVKRKCGSHQTRALPFDQPPLRVLLLSALAKLCEY